ncbi:hypothetical protein [Cellulomonas sp. RIT-PI-Y]|uniref:hypothetical protein n=1 Tax=Cellulomonas sp. RIT-PI-Y TaxID=3035297 RepID=UPI0021D7F3FC|nr:hypothetical protein [Cellulomonas sp. RIT-PI-Y]
MSAAHAARRPLRVLRPRFGASGVVGMLAGLALLAGGWFGVARVLVHQCAAIDGPLAELGQWLTLLRDVPDCPAGTLAVVPGLSQNAVLLIALALPVIAAHAAVGALGVGLVALLRRATGAARDVVAAVLPDLSALARFRVQARSRIGILVGHLDETLPSGVPGDRHPLRGPPVAVA